MRRKAGGGAPWEQRTTALQEDRCLREGESSFSSEFMESLLFILKRIGPMNRLRIAALDRLRTADPTPYGGVVSPVLRRPERRCEGFMGSFHPLCGRIATRNQLGRDAFHRVRFLDPQVADAVERVPTRFMGRVQPAKKLVNWVREPGATAMSRLRTADATPWLRCSVACPQAIEECASIGFVGSDFRNPHRSLIS